MGGLALALDVAGISPAATPLLLGALVGYVAIIGGAAALSRRWGEAPAWAPIATVLADVAFVFLFTAATTSPAHYSRTLLPALVVVQLAGAYFGRIPAATAVAASVAGYMLLVVRASMAGGIGWADALWWTSVFVVAAAVVVLQYDLVQRRLIHLVALFERAEEGDFNPAYDVRADRFPDTVTRVGRAYNKVRSQLSTMILTDPLTACLNRRGFDEALARETARAARSGADLSLLAIDLDHFKNINDSYGHTAGDVVLRDFGHLLTQSARAGDIVARTGGEEFSLLLPDTSGGGAYQFGTRLCDIVRRQIFFANGRPIKATVSVGAAAIGLAASAETGANVKERADQALYAAKRAGRDQVKAWVPALVDASHAAASTDLLSK